jgi:hypothetical protein
MPTDQSYIGQELTIFAHAINWKTYYSSIIQVYFGNRVVEVGAGIGATTRVMCNGLQEEWICLEPDPLLRSEIDILISQRKLPACCRTMGGFVSDITLEHRIDTFIYIDVLEHIKDDRGEVNAAVGRLAAGGHLIILSPAFNRLYSSFDQNIGHFRRYDKKMYQELAPSGCRLEKLLYLDAIGAATSLANRLILARAMPTVKQILFWDRRIIPLSKRIDPLIGYRFGRSLLGIWKKT